MPLRPELGTERTDAGVTVFRGEVERGTTLISATDWVTQPAEAIRQGRDLLAVLRVYEEFSAAA